MAWLDANIGLLTGWSGGDPTKGVAWRTTDAGATWTVVATPGGRQPAVTISGATAWLGGSCDSTNPACLTGVSVSEDQGVTWRAISTQPVIALAFGDRLHGWAVSPTPISSNDGEALLSSSDGGATWINRGSPCAAWTGTPSAVSFVSARIGWLACNSDVGAGNAIKAVLETQDGGATWEIRASSPWPGKGLVVGSLSGSGYLHGLAMTASGAGMNWQGRGTSERTTDAGRNWTGMSATSFDTVIAVAGWIVDAADWRLYVFNGDLGRDILETSTDAGLTWAPSPGFRAPSG